VFDNLPPGEYFVERIKEFESVYGVVTTGALDRSIVKIVPGQLATVDFARPKGAAVSGQVIGLDRPEMRKATPARVFVTVERGGETGGTQTPRDSAQSPLVDAIDAGTVFQNGDAPDGKFTTEPLPPGQYRITANLFDDSRSDVTTLDKPPLFAGEALVTVADDGQPPPVKIELNKIEPPAKNSPTPPPPKPAADAVVPKGSGSAKAEHATVPQSRDARSDLVVQKLGNLDSLLSEDLATRISKIPHVTAVAPGLMDVIAFEERNLPAIIAVGWPADSPLLRDLKIKSGRRLEDRDRGMVMVGARLAEKLKVKAGDKINVHSSDVPVVGIFESSDRFINDGIVTRLADLQEFMDAPHRITGVLVRTDIPKDDSPEHEDQMAEVRKQIEALEKEIVALPTEPPKKPTENPKVPDATKPARPEQPAEQAKAAEKPAVKTESGATGAEPSDRAWDRLGLKLSSISAREFKRLQDKYPRLAAYRGAVAITEVRAGSPAAKQHLRSGDVLVGVHVWETTSVKIVDDILSRTDFLDLMPVTFFVFRDGDTYIGHFDVAADSWSKPVGGLQARLVIERGEETNGTPMIGTYLELRNVSKSVVPLEIPLDPSKIEFKVTDAAGKEVVNAGPADKEFAALDRNLRLPRGGVLRFDVSGGVPVPLLPKDQGALLVTSSEFWVFKRGDVGAYYLRAKIAIPKTDEHLWNGTIEIPDTRIPGVTTP
jgi:hypothetical protein